MATDNKKIVKDVIIESTAKALHESDYKSFLRLRTAAEDFLNAIQVESNLYKEAINKNRIKSKISFIYQQMRNESSYTQNVLGLQHKFEEELNIFLDRKIYLTYIKPDGSINFYGDANIGKLYKSATANGGRGNISQTKIFDANDLAEDINKAITESMEDKQKVYVTAIERYHFNKKELNMNYNPSEKTFYWWNLDHETLGGHTDKIVNEGPIAEGYAKAVINEEKGIKNSSIESSLSVLWSYIHKDSVGAALKGDVVLETDDKIQFAVKTGSFSTARLGQYINLAINIQHLQCLTVEQLQDVNIFSKLLRVNNATKAILETLNQEAENAGFESIKKNFKFK